MTTKVDEIAAGIYRLCTVVPEIGPSGFTFNQFLLDDDEPLLFHTGHRSMFPSVSTELASSVSRGVDASPAFRTERRRRHRCQG
jgi:hypothetical protein